MRKICLLLLSGMLSTACVDKNYDLTDVETDDVTIGGEGSEFKCPLATVLVSMNEMAEGSMNIQAIFQEADVWLPTPLPEGKTEVDLQQLQTDQTYVSKLLNALIAQMLSDNNKLNAVAELLCEDKYVGTFLPLLPPGTTIDQFKPVFIEAFQRDATIREALSNEVKGVAGNYLTTLRVEPLEYKLDNIGISDDVVDMLAENLDPETTVNPKNTLYIYGTIVNELPVTLQIKPLFSPTEISFGVHVVANSKTNEIPKTRLFEKDLRQIVEGITIQIPVTLEKYTPGKGFQNALAHQIVIDLRMLKNGGLKLDI